MKQQNKDLTRIIWGVLGLALAVVVIVFVATFAANEVSKDSRPNSSANLVTNGGNVCHHPFFSRIFSLSHVYHTCCFFK